MPVEPHHEVRALHNKSISHQSYSVFALCGSSVESTCAVSTIFESSNRPTIVVELRRSCLLHEKQQMQVSMMLLLLKCSRPLWVGQAGMLQQLSSNQLRVSSSISQIWRRNVVAAGSVCWRH